VQRSATAIEPQNRRGRRLREAAVVRGADIWRAAFMAVSFSLRPDLYLFGLARRREGSWL
jgi:hypothetical protein